MSTGPTNTCTWSFDGAQWTLIATDCKPGSDCAMDNTDPSAPVAVTKPGRIISNADFRKAAHAGPPKRFGPNNATIPTGPGTYEMDCV